MAGLLKWDGWLENQNPNPLSGIKDHSLLGASEALTHGQAVFIPQARDAVWSELNGKETLLVRMYLQNV